MSEILHLSIHEIRPGIHQPRKQFISKDLEELAHSIKTLGLIQPVVVRRHPVRGYELIAGERRWRACKIAGLTEIPAILSQVEEQRCALMALVENIQRSDLNPMEEAEAYQRLQQDFHLTQEELATRVGKKRSTVANVLRLFSLPPDLQQALREQKMTLGHAKALLAFPDELSQRRVYERIRSEGLSVRQVEALHSPAPLRPNAHQKSKHDPDLQALLKALELHLGSPVDWNGTTLCFHLDGPADIERFADAVGLKYESWS
jgi:ParB family chromosome partitioning protein